MTSTAARVIGNRRPRPVRLLAQPAWSRAAAARRQARRRPEQHRRTTALGGAALRRRRSDGGRTVVACRSTATGRRGGHRLRAEAAVRAVLAILRDASWRPRSGRCCSAPAGLLVATPHRRTAATDRLGAAARDRARAVRAAAEPRLPRRARRARRHDRPHARAPPALLQRRSRRSATASSACSSACRRASSPSTATSASTSRTSVPRRCSTAARSTRATPLPEPWPELDLRALARSLFAPGARRRAGARRRPTTEPHLRDRSASPRPPTASPSCSC